MKKLIGLIACVMLLGLSSVFAQSKTVTGTVIDEAGLGIPGVSVAIKGTNEGAYTDIDGKWSLDVTSNDVLVFSFVGMKEQEIKVGKQTVINVTLQEDRVAVEEVMVVAYGTAKKESFTGSAAAVKKEDVLKISGSVGQKLQGKIAGVQVVGSDVRIRGFGSLTQDADPLYVVDGVVGAPKPEDEDIESITVLKDAASTALYGARGANGVIMITSKKGKKGQKPVFEFKYQRTIDKMVNPEWDRVNAEEQYRYTFLGLKNQYLNNQGLIGDFAAMKAADAAAAAYAEGKLISSFVGNNPFNTATPFNADGSLRDNAKLLYSTDWQKEMLKNAIMDELYFAVSGGSDNSHYHWATKAWDYDGMIATSYSKGVSSQFNFGVELNENIKASLVSKVSYTEGRAAYTKTSTENNLLYVGFVMSPGAPIYQKEKVMNADGTWTYKDVLVNGKRQYDWGNPNYKDYNPIALTKFDQGGEYNTKVYIAPTLDIKIIEGLTYKLQGSARLNNYKEMSFQHPLYGSGKTEGGLAGREATASRNWDMHTSFKYKFDVMDNHHFDLFAGYEANKYIYEEVGSYAKGYPLEDITTELTRGAEPKYADSRTIESSSISYITNLTYNFSEKYYLSASYRKDGSSRFGSKSRWGDFWSVGGSWRISQESFLQEEWIDNLKLRVSYGVTGNNNITDYSYGDYYSIGSFYNGNTGVAHTGLPNPNLGWEQSASTSIGLDFDLLGSRLSGTLEVYHKNTDGLLFEVPLPRTSGFDKILRNGGEMSNKGYEIQLNARPVTGDFSWDVDFVFSQNFNEIIELPDGDMIRGLKRWTEGGSAYQIYTREWAGVDRNNGNPLWFIDPNEKTFKGATYAEVLKAVGEDGYVDVTYVTPDGDKADKLKLVNGRLATSNEAHSDRFNLGTTAPKVFYGLSNSFSYKGFDASIQLVGAYGHKVYDGRYSTFMHDGTDKVTMICTDALDFWSPDNQDSKNPINIFESKNKSDYASSRWLVDGDYLKIKNITLGYTLPKDIASKIKLKNLRVFGTVDNLLTISDFKSGDPEISLSGIGTSRTFDNSITYRFGININF